MSRGRASWSNEEEQVLVDQVRQSPNNLSRAFRATSDELGKSYYAVKMQENKLFNSYYWMVWNE